MPECQCGAHVSARYARVFGDAQGIVTGCPHCMDGPSIRSGAAHPDRERVSYVKDVPRRVESRKIREARS